MEEALGTSVHHSFWLVSLENEYFVISGFESCAVTFTLVLDHAEGMSLLSLAALARTCTV